jgi:dienelactone hydrolase
MPFDRHTTLARMQEVMGPLPEKPSSPPPFRTLLEEDFPSYRRIKVLYEPEPGDAVPAWLLVPRGAKPCRPVLCLHQTQKFGKDESAGIGTRFTLQYAKELANLGYITLSPDYPNFGEYFLDVYARGYVSATMKAIVNHRRAIDLLLNHPRVRARAAGVIGHSLGGHNALFVSAFDDRIQATVTSCGFTSFPKYYGGNLTGWSHNGYMPRIASAYGKDPARMPFDFPDVLAAIAPRALFVNAPLHDSNFEVSGVRDCITAVQPLFPNPGFLEVHHPDSGHDFPDREREAAYAFLSRHLSAE